MQSKSKNVDVTVGQKFPLTIKRLGINGEGIGYFKHKIVFVPETLPNEVITAKVIAVAPHFIRAKVQRLRTASPDRVKPVDPLYGKVGGLDLEHMNYNAQLAFKRDVVAQSLEKFKPQGYENYDLRPTIPSAPYQYRNKAQFPVALQDNHVIAGLYEEGSHHLVNVKAINTQMPVVTKIINQLKTVLEDLKTPIYNERRQNPGVRTLVVRASATTAEIQVTLVVSDPELLRDNALFAAIQTRIPAITSFFINVNPHKTSLIWGEDTTHIFGTETITEKINGKTFKLSPQAFFQLNPKQTQTLYKLATEAFDFNGSETLVDAYCGVGTLGITMADRVKTVRGMDIIPEGIEDAKANAKLNGANNCHYEVGKAEVLLTDWFKAGQRIDALVVDPPRTGLTEALAKAIARAKPKQFVYISCNPSTLARDLVALSQAYSVDYIQSIDMFPQTARCEAIVKLSLK
ncbi:RNA methyltransferase [Agrilactobacillus composti DSM 18527 = JCM 14202]|uniref:RNA methyltransferase n=1 Tax=Agrilactobacillus composti DSM 18527 = JCM 14202 TaxID=1423734 RepID=X0PF17_9LACO|nr:23S rRNA (uracil(1939)-C(5))-methyltransferase RlmD [Agrilactobacillus composti]KRM31462.1 RNA methyltransferase [Agrilactobacillus composti DSM 18527 = JCM 14202]GAF40419.1 RNA methyltransferase, TrmA family [Agrilactobacillus composti DSM 18527 = JCM 14202]